MFLVDAHCIVMFFPMIASGPKKRELDRPEEAPHAEPHSIAGSYVLLALTILLIWFGVYPAPLLKVIRTVLPI
jgi:NADH:ubiquinone oxidoreductase subunit 4 (subunit M)